MLDRESAIPIPTGIPEGIKVGNELPDSVFNPEVGKPETFWKSSASVLTKINWFLFIKEEPGYSWRRISQGREGTKPLERTGGNSSRALGITGWEKKSLENDFFYLKAIGRVGKTNTKPRQIPEGSQLLKSHWKFLKIWAGISSSVPGKAGLSQLGIPSWKRGTWQETVRNPDSHFGLFFHPGMTRDFGR